MSNWFEDKFYEDWTWMKREGLTNRFRIYLILSLVTSCPHVSVMICVKNLDVGVMIIRLVRLYAWDTIFKLKNLCP